MTNPNSELVFHKLTAVISGKALNNLVKKYDSDYRVQHFDTRSHLYALLYFNMKGLSSLRDLQTHLSNSAKLKRLINAPSLSQFSRKNASRDYRIFEELYTYLVGITQKRFGLIKARKDLPDFKIIDSSLITLALKLAPDLQYDKTKAGIKISTLYNGQYPEMVQIVKGITSDRRCVNEFFTDKNSVYIFDRGYYDYRWYDRLTEKGIKFITRGISNAIVSEEKMLYSDPGRDIYDTEVIMGSTPGGNLTFKSYREIMAFTADGEPITFITNIFDLSTDDIISLYRKRWEIEVFFRWLKQNLRIKKWIGYNDNAIRIQIYAALITYLLVYIMKNTAMLQVSMLKIMRVVKVNLLEQMGEEFLTYLTG